MLIAAWDPLTIWTAVLVIFTFPSGYLAWVTVQDRKDRKARQAQRAKEQKAQEAQQAEVKRLYEQLGVAFWGHDRSKWPKPGDENTNPVVPLVEAINHQVKPSNGKTTAATVEEIKTLVQERNEMLEDLQKGMAQISVLVAEHVSDGHGGQRSW